MSRCPKCGAEVESGMNFCLECGAKIPQDKECLACHARVPAGAKFCSSCAYDFMKSDSPAAGAAVGIGDKNVIAGDVNLSNTTNTTNYINQDETRRVVKCAACGKSIVITEAFSCVDCGEYVCEDHYDKAHRKCMACHEKQVEDAESRYRAKLDESLEDGIIDADEFGQLESLRKELGISSDRSMELTKQAKAARLARTSAKTVDTPLMTVEKAQCERARQILFENGNAQEAVALLESIHQNHPVNEDVLDVFLTALQMFDAERARKVIGELPVDTVIAYLTLVDLELRKGDLAEAERKLAAAEKLWPDSNLVKCRRVALMYATAKELENRTFLVEAMDILTSIPEPTDKLEKSWCFHLQYLISKELGDEVPVLDKALCQEQGLYYALMDGTITGLRGETFTPSPEIDAESAGEDECLPSDDSMDEQSVRDMIMGMRTRFDWDNFAFLDEGRFHGLWENFAMMARKKIGCDLEESNAIALLDCTAVDDGKFGALLDESGIYVVNMRPPNAQFNGFLSWEDFAQKGEVCNGGGGKFYEDVVQICSDPRIGLDVFPRCNNHFFNVDMVKELFSEILHVINRTGEG